jgi:hypothetical protein
MRTSQDYDVTYPAGDLPAGIGWVTFAAVLLGVAGVWNSIDGILAIADSRVYTNSSTFVFSDLNTWGWIMLILGIIQLIAAGSLVAGSEFGRWFGIGAAALNAIGQLMFVTVYPWWGVAMFTLDVLVIYGLTVYAGKRLRTE